MKIVGMILLCLSGLWLASALIGRAEKRVRCVASLAKLVENAKRAVENYSMTASEILLSCGEELIRACGYCRVELPQSFLEMSRGCEIGDEESRRIFFEFAQDFGKNYRERQTEKCEDCALKLKLREEYLTDQLAVKKKLIFCGCISLSLVAVILLL